ncbi:MAG: hypothetical protein ABEJ75_04175 [Candidatus Nanohaloarchaea archaeon]
MRRKGLSQILWLIIAAAVMMMIALVLVFSTQSSLSNLVGGSQSNACRAAIQSRASTMGAGATFKTPANCIRQNSAVISSLADPSGSGNNYHEEICVTDNTGSWKGIEEGTSCS